MRQAYNGEFDKAYEVFEKCFGKTEHFYRGFLINYIFEMTLGFAEKIVRGYLEDTEEMEKCIWTGVKTFIEGSKKVGQIREQLGVTRDQF